jgi:hypothetical protein
MPLDVDPDLCDEFAFTILSYESMAEVISSRQECPEIHGYYYSGPFEDDLDLIVGPDYSVLVADSALSRETQIDAYLCGFRTDVSKLV